MADFDIGDGLHKVLLAGIGALATGVEKGQEIVDNLVKKGELTVEQGKILNTELKRNRQGQGAGPRTASQSSAPGPVPTPGQDAHGSGTKPGQGPLAGGEGPLARQEPHVPLPDPRDGDIPITSADPVKGPEA
ncbi:hypothetical protein [Bifidobacterium indicum]|uniref:phasin family protein n=1 Tax=Bifidobacterium indicum TaxID=1691 RepID=UPI002613F6EE|nr:hypothetical protein [uncultured Bifidobacterium sp.]